MTRVIDEMEERSGKRILVVEDDGAILETVAPILEEEGYRVSTASNGGEALEQLRLVDLPDVILLDLQMPVMDGWKFRNVQRRDSRLASIPVIAISADGTQQAEAISANAFLRKPLDLTALLATIARVIAENEHQRQASHREHVERLASLGRLAAGLGHEINNPLAFAMMNVTLANDRARKIAASRYPAAQAAELLTEEARQLAAMLGDALVGLERIRDIVHKVQNLTRHRDTRIEAVRVEKVLDESVAIAWSQIQHRARVTRHYADVPAVKGNAGALGQVFLNLLINAAQAIREGDASTNEICVRTSFDGSDVTVEISDTGPGIAADVLPHVFDPFFSTKSADEGTGLGLAICQQIISDHDGRLTIESEIGRGTLCRLSLRPFAVGDDKTVPAAEACAPSPQAARRGRILVIDDEAMIGQVIARMLVAHHDVIACQSARDAYRILAQCDAEFDLVLCDVLMPDIGGSEVLDELAARWRHLVPRLVFMTGGVSSSEGMDFIGRTQVPVLRKPFMPAELEKVVDRYL